MDALGVICIAYVRVRTLTLLKGLSHGHRPKISEYRRNSCGANGASHDSFTVIYRARWSSSSTVMKNAVSSMRLA